MDDTDNTSQANAETVFRMAGLSPDSATHTYAQYQKAVPAFPYVLKFLRPDLIDEQLCRTVVKCKGFSLEDVPERFQTPALCALAVEQGASLASIPPACITPAMQLQAVTRRPAELKLVPLAEQTLEMIETAGRHAPSALQFANRQLLDTAACQRLIDAAPQTIRWIPKRFRTQALYRQMVRNDPRLLSQVPEAQRDPELCWLVLERARGITKSAIKHLPQCFLTPDTCLRLIEMDFHTACYITQVAPPAQDALKDPQLIQRYQAGLAALDPVAVHWTRDAVLGLVVEAMIASIPLGKLHLDDWMLPRDHTGRAGLDEVQALAEQLLALLPEDERVERFHARVFTLVETQLTRRQVGSIEASDRNVTTEHDYVL